MEIDFFNSNRKLGHGYVDSPVMEAKQNTPKDQDKNKKKNVRQLNMRFQQRITIARQGQEAIAKQDYINGIKFFNMYFKILSDVKDVESHQLSPTMFDEKTSASEIMLISHIYWELTKIYDKTPKLESEFHKSLNKFLEFTINYRHQVINAEMMRKFIKKNRHQHKEVFNNAYKRLYTASQKCYIATYCFGEDHEITNSLRVFKKWLADYSWGRSFINYYYLFSPVAVELGQKNKFIDQFITPFMIRPLLSISVQISRRLMTIIKRFF